MAIHHCVSTDNPLVLQATRFNFAVSRETSQYVHAPLPGTTIGRCQWNVVVLRVSKSAYYNTGVNSIVSVKAKSVKNSSGSMIVNRAKQKALPKDSRPVSQHFPLLFENINS